jgi:hypothetical protein
MSAARLATDDWSQLCKSVEGADALTMLKAWQTAGAKLGFGYFRSGAGVMQTGRAALVRVTQQLLTLDTGGSRLVVLLEKARFQFGNLGFLTPDFRGVYDVEGLSATTTGCARSQIAKTSIPHYWHASLAFSLMSERVLCQPPNKRMQRARDPDKCVLCLVHRRVADARRYTSS